VRSSPTCRCCSQPHRFRRWHLRWAAIPGELEAALPGDDLLPSPQFRCTRAITIQALPSLVWPGLVQVGCFRSGFYGNDLLDNLGRPSARVIVPELNQWLLWRKPDSTWVWKLIDAGDGTTVW
jgi:hypothetical protein